MYQKINGTALDDAEDLDLVMSIYTFFEYSSNYSDMTGSLWFYSKDEATDFNNDITDTNDFKSFKYKAKLLGNNEADEASRNVTHFRPMFHLRIKQEVGFY